MQSADQVEAVGDILDANFEGDEVLSAFPTADLRAVAAGLASRDRDADQMADGTEYGHDDGTLESVVEFIRTALATR